MIEIKKQKTERIASPDLVYCYGETILKEAEKTGRVFFDTDGTPVLLGEFYEVTPKGIRRIG